MITLKETGVVSVGVEERVDPTAIYPLPVTTPDGNVVTLCIGHCTEHQMTEVGPRTLAVARVWRGRTRREIADEYERYNYEEGIKPLIEKARAVQTFRRDGDTETEFTTISFWDSIEAMAAFAGSDPTAIHHLPRDGEFLIELPTAVEIMELRVDRGTR
jgi:hypothetical protein